MQHTHSSQTAKQPNTSTTQLLLAASMPSHALPCPHCLSPWHDQLRRGGEGGIKLMSNKINLYIPPSPPLLSWSWHGEAVGHGRGHGRGQRHGSWHWVVVGCLAAVGVLHMFFAIWFKWCAMRAKANVVMPERAYLYPLGRELYQIAVNSREQDSSRSRWCCIFVIR